MPDKKNKQKSVPESRISRFGHMTRLAGRVAKGVATEGIRQVASGNLPKLNELLLTPANAKRLTEELSRMRGAAMKFGQLLSMDAGDFLPEELANILARLRSDAHIMPQAQLEQQLKRGYGVHWQDQFAEFNSDPVAAASIGQVHQAILSNGDKLALKIQYPGVRKSIDSDVANIASLIRMTGLLPKSVDLEAIMEEVKRQLRNEADYNKEANYLQQFSQALANDTRFLVPKYYQELSSINILAMEFLESEDIEVLKNQSQEERNRVVEALFELLLSELFELRLMQTDPNYGNYRYQLETKKIVLLDFGASRKFTKKFVQGYKKLLNSLAGDDEEAMLAAAEEVGYINPSISPGYREIVLSIFAVIGEMFKSDEPYDFKNSQLPSKIQTINANLVKHKDEWRAPPIESLFVHRKLAGLYLLAGKLDAKVALKPLLAKYE